MKIYDDNMKQVYINNGEVLMVGNYKIITFCGSTRFKNEFIEAQKRLTLEGAIVICAGLFGHCRYTIHLDNFLNCV